MRIHISIMPAAIAIVAVFLGAGCSQALPPTAMAPKANMPVATTSADGTAATRRIPVPDLGFSYVPYTTDTSIYGGVTTSGTRLLFGDMGTEFRSFDFIERVPKTNGESIDDALRIFMESSGGSPEHCSIVTATSTEGTWDWLSGGLETMTFVPKTAYRPTDIEIRNHLRSTTYPNSTEKELDALCENSPECGWAKDDLIQKRNEAQCGMYAVSAQYQSVSMFIADPMVSSTLLYVHTTGGGDRPAFDGGPIQILP